MVAGGAVNPEDGCGIKTRESDKIKNKALDIYYQEDSIIWQRLIVDGALKYGVEQVLVMRADEQRGSGRGGWQRKVKYDTTKKIYNLVSFVNNFNLH